MDPNQQQVQQQAYNPHQSQYYPQFVQPQPYSTPYPAPRVIPFSKPWHTTKIVLRSFDLAFCIIALGLASYLAALPYFSNAIVFIICTGPPAALGIIWEVAEFITICARGGKLGIHPGAHVGLHLVIWLACGAAIGVEATIFDLSGCGTSCRRTGYVSAALSTGYATLAFTSLMLLMNFILFIRACVETHQRNQQAAPIVMVSGGNAPIYMTGPPQMMAQQYPPAMYQPSPQQPPHSSVSYGTPSPQQVPPQQLPPQELRGQMTGNSLTPSNPDTYKCSNTESISGDGTYYGPNHQQHRNDNTP